MPELAEIECLRSRLSDQFLGRKIARVTVARNSRRQGVIAETFASTSGLFLQKIDRRGKFLVFQLSDGTSLLLHCGMSGRVISRTEKKPHDLFYIVFSDEQRLTYNDYRRFGRIWRVRTQNLSKHPSLQKLGPEPLSKKFHQNSLNLISKRSVKSVLLDQEVVAGLGNIYACESLYHARIRPDRQFTSLTAKERARLVKAIKSTLRSAIGHGGSTLEDYRDTEGEAGNYDSKFAVFAREGLPCPNCNCQTGVIRIKQAGRSTFYCAIRQQ